MARKFFGGMIGKSLPIVTPSSAPSLDLNFDGTASSGTGDDHFDDVVLLLDGSSATTDLSDTAQTITNNNNVSVANSHPFGNGQSLTFDGSPNTSLSISNPPASLITWNSGAYTAEGWINASSFSTGSATTNRIALLANAQDTGTTIVTEYWSFGVVRTTSSTTKLYFYYYNGAAVYNESTSSPVGTNTWHHIAFSVSGSTVRGFVDGSEVLSFTISGTPQQSSSWPFVVGKQGTEASITGQVTDVRITSGVARYTSAFTPPSAKLPTAKEATSLDKLATDIVTQNKSGNVQSKYMGPNGKLINGYVENLVEYSDFTNAAWTAGSAYQVETANGAGPFGGNAARIVVAATGDAWLYDDVSATSYNLVGETMTYSLFAKSTNSTLTLNVYVFGPTNNPAAQLQVNPSTGGSATDTSTNITLSDYGSTDVGNGWHRYWMSFVVPSNTTALRPNIVAAVGTTYAYGPQLETTATPSLFVPRFGNLVPNSIDLQQSAGWSGNLDNTTRVVPGQADPYGGNNATKLNDDDGNFRFIEAVTTFPSSNDYWCSSIFVKKNSGIPGDGTSEVRCLCRVIVGTSPNEIYHDFVLDPNTGNTSSSSGTYGSIVSLQDLGDWYRMSVAGQAGGAADTKATFQFFPDVGGTWVVGGTNFTPGAEGSVIVFGPQLERGSSPTAYNATAAQVPRLEYGSSGNPLGLLVEEERENLLPNSEDLSSYSLVNRATATTNTAVAPDGSTTADTLTEDNSSNTTHYARNSISVTSGTTYTYSVYCKANTRDHVRVLLGDPANAFPSGDTGINVDLTDGSYTGGTALDASSVTNVGNGWWRISVTSTAISTTSSGYAYVFLHDGASANYDGDNASNIFVWGAQLEQGAGPTSYIPTSGASALRPADDITLSTSSFGYSDVAGSVLANFTLASETSSGDFPHVWTLTNAAGTSKIAAFMDETATPDNLDLIYRSYAGGANPGTYRFRGTVTQPTYGSAVALSMRYADGNFGSALDGTLSTSPTENTSGETYTGLSRTSVELGGDAVGNAINGHIRRFTYWPRAISDEQLAEYTDISNIKYFGEDVTSNGIKNPGVLSLNEHYLFSKQ